MASRGALALGILFVLLPWAVILVDAALGFNLLLAVAMLVVFSVGLVFVSAVAAEA